jgi:hypothetical protein
LKWIIIPGRIFVSSAKPGDESIWSKKPAATSMHSALGQFSAGANRGSLEHGLDLLLETYISISATARVPFARVPFASVRKVLAR